MAGREAVAVRALFDVVVVDRDAEAAEAGTDCCAAVALGAFVAGVEDVLGVFTVASSLVARTSDTF